MKNTPTIGFFSTFKSTFAAFFGVQSEEQRERDFAGGRPAYFILAGLLATVLFVVAIIFVVKLVLANTAL